MPLRTIVIGLLLWIGINALVPLVINSLERLYQPHIDRFVSRTISAISSVAIRLLQLVLIVIMAPTIAILAILERVVGVKRIERMRSRSRLFNEQWVVNSAIMRRDFPSCLRSGSLRLD